MNLSQSKTATPDLPQHPAAATASDATLEPLEKKRANDLEIKDAQIIFESIWRDLEAEIGRENMCFPKELILLGGAPGAGKGTNTEFIRKTRDLTCQPIVVSALLDSPEARKLKAGGKMVGDREVITLVWRELLKSDYSDGAILDGFPRTKVQVECLKLLVNKMQQLRADYHHTPLSMRFRRPTIHIMVLFVDEKTSVDRQLKRGRDIKQHNEEIRRTGIGELQEERPTDYDVPLAQLRYRVFKEQTWAALQSLKENFNYHFINAEGSVTEVEKNILAELSYQSALELDPSTNDRLSSLPLASHIIVHARQELVKRLDGYEMVHTELFKKVVEFIEKRLMPVIKRHALSGRARINVDDVLLDDPLALSMLVDIFSERGFHATVDVHYIEVPERVDLHSGRITHRVKNEYRIHVFYQGAEIRR